MTLQNFTLGTFAQGAAGGGGASFESIATATGTGSSGTITFSSIPSTYKHLQIRAICKNSDTGSSGAANIFLTFNSDTAGNYTRHLLYGDGSATGAFGNANTTYIQLAGNLYDGTSNNPYGAVLIDILDYASTSKFKTARSFSGYDANGSGQVNIQSGLWRSTSAVNAITLVSSGSTNWKTGTQFALYGIKG